MNSRYNKNVVFSTQNNKMSKNNIIIPPLPPMWRIVAESLADVHNCTVHLGSPSSTLNGLTVNSSCALLYLVVAAAWDEAGEMSK